MRRGQRGALALVAAVVAGALAPRPALALPHEAPLRTLVRDSFRDRDGLPMNAVRAILHARNGPLWVGTDEGLARLDGAEILQIGRREAPGLPSEIITALAESSDGVLWVGTYDGGLVRHAGGRFEPVAMPGAPAGLRISSLCPDAAGGLWIGSGVGLFHLAGGRVRAFSMAQGLPDDRVNDVALDRDGAIWVALRRGLVRVVAGRVEPGPPALQGASVRVLRPDPAGGIWAGAADHGVARVAADGTVTRYGQAQGLPGEPVTALELDRHGALWIGTQAGGLARLHEGKVERLGSKDGLPSDWISAVHEDREGSVWVGTQDAGLVRLREGDFHTIGKAEGLSHDSIEALLQARNGDLWVATDGGVDLLRGGAMPARRVMGGAPMSLLEDHAGAIWIGTFGEGLWRQRDGRFERLEHRLPPGTWFRTLVEDLDGVVWAGTTDGLYRVHGSRLAPVSDGLPTERPAVVALAATTSGLFVATEGAGVFRRGGGRFVREEAGPPEVWVVSGFLADADGTLWLATEGGGLWRRRGGAYAHVTVAQGLHTDTLWTILGDEQGALWISSNRGIFRVARADLEAVLDGRAERLTARAWSMDDGLRSQEGTGLSHPGGWRGADGRLWFATLRGVSVVDPTRVRPEPPPPAAVFQRVAVAGQPLPTAEPVTLPPDAGHLEFEFDADVLAGQRRAAFRYRLAGFEDGWSESSGRRAAQYTNLPAGDYRFEVQARMGDGAWGPVAAVPVRQEAPAWRSRPVLGAAALLGAGALLLTWRLLRRRAAAAGRAREAALLAATSEVEALSALLPRCGWCKAERSDPAYLAAVDAAMRARPAAQFDHGQCPACAARRATGAESGGPGEARPD